MSTHPTPAERLLSMLEEKGAVEVLPVGEVHDELAALGVDPARSIAFAKAMARGGDSPGGHLMGALTAGEEEDDEIARIESADIEEVRAKVHHGAAAAITAEARRKAGIDDNVVGLDAKRRKRRRLIVWGGPLAGIAASVLVVVVFLGNAFLSSDRMEIADNISGSRVKSPEAELPDPAMEGETKPGLDKSLTDEMLAMDVPPELDSAERSKEKNFADSDVAGPSEEMLALNEPAPPPAATAEKKSDTPAKLEERLRKQEENLSPPVMSTPPRKPAPGDGKMAIAPAAPVDTLGGSAGAEGDLAADDERSAEISRSTGPAVLPGIVAPPSSDLAGETFEAETGIAALQRAEKDEATAFGRTVEISEIAAVLVVDPSQAPLQIQSPILPSGELANRVEEAQRLAGDRPVIALYTVVTGPARQDFAQVPLQAGVKQQLAAPPPLIGLLGVEASEYDFIALPAE
ncbi:MAG: hypothetical protein ABFS30_01620 [Pseudomonadota bacterium]